MRRTLAAVVTVVVLMLTAAPLMASVDVLSLEQQLKCPTCDTPLNVSNAPSAQRIKSFIETKAADGWTSQQIENSLVAQFGRDILATPPKSGFDLVVWLVPVGLILAGIIALPLITRAWVRQRRQSVAANVSATPEELDRLDKELRKFGG